MSTDTIPTSLAEAMVDALAQMTGVAKGRKADVGKYKYAYANLEDVVGLSRPILAENGLTAVQSLEDVDGRIAISTTILHRSGETMTFGPVSFHAGNNAQDAGSAITYYRRYALLAALGLAAEDDDGHAASAPPAKKAAANGTAVVTEAQMTKIHTLFSKAEIDGRDDRLAHVVELIGRKIESSKDLTKAEASKVIDDLEMITGGRP